MLSLFKVEFLKKYWTLGE